MEDKRTPVIHTIKIPPPSETPPSQEKNITPHIETTQWLDDVKTTATISLIQSNTPQAALLSGTDYTPKITKLSDDIAINQYQLKAQRCKHINSTKNTHTVHQLHIPTPKANIHQDNTYEHANTLHYTI